MPTRSQITAMSRAGYRTKMLSSTHGSIWVWLLPGGVQGSSASYNTEPQAWEAAWQHILGSVQESGSQLKGTETFLQFVCSLFDSVMPAAKDKPLEELSAMEWSIRVKQLSEMGYDVVGSGPGRFVIVKDGTEVEGGPFTDRWKAWDHAIKYILAEAKVGEYQPHEVDRNDRVEELKAEGYSVELIPGTTGDYYPAHNGKHCSHGWYPSEAGAWNFIINCPKADLAELRKVNIQRLKGLGYSVRKVLNTGKFTFYLHNISPGGRFRTEDAAWDAAQNYEAESQAAAETNPEITVWQERRTGHWHWRSDELGIKGTNTYWTENAAMQAALAWHKKFKVETRN